MKKSVLLCAMIAMSGVVSGTEKLFKCCRKKPQGVIVPAKIIAFNAYASLPPQAHSRKVTELTGLPEREWEELGVSRDVVRTTVAKAQRYVAAQPTENAKLKMLATDETYKRYRRDNGEVSFESPHNNDRPLTASDALRRTTLHRAAKLDGVVLLPLVVRTASVLEPDPLIQPTSRNNLASPTDTRQIRVASDTDTSPLPGSVLSSPASVAQERHSSSTLSSSGADDSVDLGGSNSVLVEVSKKAMRASRGSHWRFGSTPARAADDSPPSHDNTDLHFMA